MRNIPISAIDPSFYDCVYSTTLGQTIVERCYKDIGCCATTCCNNDDWYVTKKWSFMLLFFGYLCYFGYRIASFAELYGRHMSQNSQIFVGELLLERAANGSSWFVKLTPSVRHGRFHTLCGVREYLTFLNLELKDDGGWVVHFKVSMQKCGFNLRHQRLVRSSRIYRCKRS